MKILITGAWNHALEYLDKIKQQGHSVIFMQHEKNELPCSYDWAEGIICNGLFLSHPIEKFKNLKYIQLTSAGFDRVPMEYIKEKKIEIYNARGVYSIPMAEFAVGAILQLYKKVAFFFEKQKKHRWEKNRDLLELCGKEVCIVGCGNVGTECAKRFQAFDCRVVGVDLFPREDRYYSDMVRLELLDTILPETDILVLTLPLTEETRHLIDSRRLSLLKNEAILVNIARGAVIDTSALITALDRLGGAVLDVLEEEPLDRSSPLWDMENVIITPHNSFVGEGNGRRLDTLIMKTLEERGKQL
nr:NAD(P)-dependent oxidoreductase [uncultured Schaedlerella sp.]